MERVRRDLNSLDFEENEFPKLQTWIHKIPYYQCITVTYISLCLINLYFDFNFKEVNEIFKLRLSQIENTQNVCLIVINGNLNTRILTLLIFFGKK